MNKKGIVVVTGSSNGIGYATAKKFLDEGYNVHGIDIDESRIAHDEYVHHIADVSRPETLPDISEVSILINNAGQQTPETNLCKGSDIDVNLRGMMYCTAKYAIKDSSKLKSIVNMASVSAHNGAEFPEYVASKGGVLSYTVWAAKYFAPKGVTVNSLSFGGVETALNLPVMQDKELWNAIMDETPMKKWMSAKEAAEWVYFLSVVNKSCTGQDIIVDNGEMINHNFIWR